MIDQSDQNLSSTSHMFGNWVQDAGQGQVPQDSGSNHSLTDQSHINSPILAQLSSLGAQLDNMEISIIKSVEKISGSTKIKNLKAKLKRVWYILELVWSGPLPLLFGSLKYSPTQSVERGGQDSRRGPE